MGMGGALPSFFVAAPSTNGSTPSAPQSSMTLPSSQSHLPRDRSHVPASAHSSWFRWSSGQSNTSWNLAAMEKSNGARFSASFKTEMYQTPLPAALNSSASSRIRCSSEP